MPTLSPVLILNIDEDIKTLEMRDISSDDIPSDINGEKGFHVYHVRMLTELILREINNVTDKYSLTDEEINFISIASSLHDIGKNSIPRSILDFPGKLSPVEYDIIKKHTVLGYEMIDSVPSDIDGRIIQHAKDIAKYHHERIDGTGYPEGLKGEEIPISARVVSIADSFDALTSSRSYKEAFSQDVAIEMISNGMSGLFDEFLVQCLLNVVNDKDLVAVRESMSETLRVVTDPDTLAVKRVLIVGNTGYIREDFIENTFEGNNVVIAGETHLKSRSRLKIFNGKRLSYDKIFETYDFDIIIFFSRELTYRTTAVPDAEILRNILSLTTKHQKDAKIIYFSSLDGVYAEKNDKGILTLSKENLCEFYTAQYGIDIKIVRIPYLYSGTKDGDFLNTAFKQMETGIVTLDEKPESRTFFVSMHDISLLISRFIENWQQGIGILSVNDEFNITFLDIFNRAYEINPGFKVIYSGEGVSNNLNIKNVALRNEYGWFSRISIIMDIEEEYQKFLVSNQIKTEGISGKIKSWIEKHKPAVKIAEIGLMFVITELLNIFTGSSVAFSVVDFRMAFIVIIATVHGLYSGLAAATLSSVAWLIAKIVTGTSWLTIFYEPANWFVFVYYFLVAAVSGYVRLTKDDKIKFFEEQIELLEEKLEFTRALYQDTFNEKRDLKKQIIGSKDSFGKIFDVTRNLDTVEPHKLYLKIMDTFEDILENKSISVYSVNDKSVFGRLEVASRDILNEASRSIALDAYKPVIEEIHKDEIWRNTEFLPNLPMYAAGVWRNDKLELIIFIWYVRSEQNSLYYVNLFKILRDLVEISLLRAYDYNKYLCETHYIQGTHILVKSEFEKIYVDFKNMAERKVFSFQFMEIGLNGHSYEEVEKMLAGKMRANDILGETEGGSLAILFSQATEKDLKFIMPRFENLDLTVKIK